MSLIREWDEESPMISWAHVIRVEARHISYQIARMRTATEEWFNVRIVLVYFWAHALKDVKVESSMPEWYLKENQKQQIVLETRLMKYTQTWMITVLGTLHHPLPCFIK